MFTLDEIKQIMDADDALTLDGYNLVRTNIMSAVAPALDEVNSMSGKIKELEIENDRLKQANMTLYNKVEKQIMRADLPIEEPTEPEEPEKTPEEILKDNIAAYMSAI